ncbi:hypothetical protein [Hellea balneolensis]|uniref:hypothetical protein n=1 Tax=Hellea balneolensis TaxID=287478 RepID=UPI00040D3212|nr:hypothetical protein [Hellea balneolensis]
MKLIKRAFLVISLSAILFANGTHDPTWAQEQIVPAITGSTPARTVQTSAEDITLTNSCIESGKEKIYCLCVTKIFKNEMSVHEYRGAVSLYGQENNSSPILENNNYSQTDINEIKARMKDLSTEKMFRTRCNRAEIYFASATES